MYLFYLFIGLFIYTHVLHVVVININDTNDSDSYNAGPGHAARTRR